MLEQRFTFLTGPVSGPVGRTANRLRAALRVIWYAARMRRPPPKPEFGGHPAVTRSIARGMRKLQVKFVLDPERLSEVSLTCHVISNLAALKQAILLKRRGQIRRLVAGPNLVVLPSDAPELMSAPEIDLMLVNSPWTHDLYVDEMPALLGRTAIWPAGIDAEFWKPAPSAATRKDVLIYVKSVRCQELIGRCRDILDQERIVHRTIEYGHYSPHEYRQALASSAFAVFFSDFESQGLALAEAWSMDVPTLVWDPGYFEFYHSTARAKGWATSSSPYLTRKTGERFSTPVEMESKIAALLTQPRAFAPRSWVLGSLTEEICAQHLLSLIQGELEPAPALSSAVHLGKPTSL